MSLIGDSFREFFKITIDELKVIFNTIEDKQIDIGLEKETDFICKVNNNIFELLFTFMRQLKTDNPT